MKKTITATKVFFRESYGHPVRRINQPYSNWAIQSGVITKVLDTEDMKGYASLPLEDIQDLFDSNPRRRKFNLVNGEKEYWRMGFEKFIRTYKKGKPYAIRIPEGTIVEISPVGDYEVRLNYKYNNMVISKHTIKCLSRQVI